MVHDSNQSFNPCLCKLIIWNIQYFQGLVDPPIFQKHICHFCNTPVPNSVASDIDFRNIRNQQTFKKYFCPLRQ